MASIREQALARVKTALAAALPGGASVSRSREVSISRLNAPTIVVMARSNSISTMSSEVDQNQFDLVLEIFVRGDPWDSLADPIDVAAHAIMMSDVPLQAIVSNVRRTGEAFESQEADLTAGVLSVHYRITFMSRAVDISRAP